MPTYVYKFVKTGETIEVQQSFDDPPLTKAKHPTTNRQMAVKKVFTPVGVTFRGNGFYKTDSRSSTRSNGASTSSSDSKSTESSSSESKSSDTTSSDTKSSDTKSTSDNKSTSTAKSAD